jgi:hypothetical protein
VNRVLLWLLISVAVWEGLVYLHSHPRFWLRVVQGCTWVGTRALYIYNITKTSQERRDADHRAREGVRPRTGDTVTDIEEYLRRKRSP